MSSTSDINVILSQGNTIKEVHNVKKQNLEPHQQFVAQHSEDKKREDKTKVKEFDKSNKIEVKKRKEKKKGKKSNKKDLKKKKQKEINELSEGTIIDITV